MNTIKLWELPVLSTCLYDNGVNLYYAKANATLTFDYYDQNDNDQVYNGGIFFETVLCHRHSSERFTKSLMNAYDTLVEIKDSQWLKELKGLNETDYGFWKLKHFAIYFDGYGLYEFIAKTAEPLTAQLGSLEEFENGLSKIK